MFSTSGTVVPKLLREFHEGFCGDILLDEFQLKKILAARFHLLTIFKGTFDYCKRRKICQALANKSAASGNLHHISP